MDSLQSWFRASRLAIVGALLTAVVLLVAGSGLLDIYRARLILDAQEAMLSAVPTQVAALTTSVNRRLSVVSALRAFTVVDPSPTRLDAEFQTFVADLAASVDGIRNLSLAPAGVQTYVYPMEGNEGVLGHDLMTDARPEVRADVARAIETGTIALSGPYELRQGGLGLVVRLAVTYDGEFWGLVAAVLDIPPLLDDAGLTSDNPRATYALVDGGGRVFAGDEAVLLQNPVTAVVMLPESEWRLAAVPVDGWAAAVHDPLRVARVAGIFLVGLVSGGVYLLIGRERQVLNTAQSFARDFAATQYWWRSERDETSWTEITQVANSDALKISLVYVVLGSLWILLSDCLLVTFGLGAAALTQIQTLKGWLFVVATALLLYFIVRRRLVQVHQSTTLAVTSEKKYRVLAESTLDVIWQMDLDFTFTYINPAVEGLLGYAPNEIVGNSLAAYAPDEDLQRMESRIVKALNSEEYGGGAQMRCKLRHSDGSLIPVEIRGNIIVDGGQAVGVQGLVRDVRERDEAEREHEQLLARIQEQSLLVERIIDAVPDGVLTLDARRRPILVNPAAEQILGLLAQYDAGECGALTHLGDRPLAKLLTSPPRGLWHEVRMEDRVFQVIARSVEEQLVSDGAPDDRWVLVLHDATSEHEVRTRVEEQARLSALGQMAAGIAHDFNNILAVVMLYTQMALRTPDLGSATQERLQVVLDQAERATALVRQILDFGCRGAMEVRELDLVGLLEEEVLLLQRTLPESIAVTLAHSDGPCRVSADPRRLQQAIANLAVNARDAMPGGGELRLAVSKIQVDATSVPPLPDLSEGRWVQITVEDTGEGIPEEVVSRIFEPFFTTKDPGKGSGLGLAQVYGIIQQHSGQIGVVSDVGRGTRFTICLPAVQVSAAGDELADLATAPRGKGELVLLVEDHAATRVALVESLELLSYRVVTAVHGGEALAVLDRQGHDVAVVLSDYVMPEVNGRELFFALKSRGSPVPMVILTGHPVTADLDDLVADGLCGWLPKPPDLARLAHLLARVLGG